MITERKHLTIKEVLEKKSKFSLSMIKIIK